MELSDNKAWVFSVAGALIAASAWAIYRPDRTCPADSELAAACARADKWNRRFIVVSAALWLVGLFFAFVLIRI